MYTIKAYVDSKEYTIHDARVKALTVGGNPYFEIGDNINGCTCPAALRMIYTI